MRFRTLAIVSLTVVNLLCLATSARASNEVAPNAWPEKLVAMEQLEALTRYNFRVRGLVTKGKVTGPAVLRAHVDATGAVVRTVLHSSCGNTDLDEVAMRGMQDMRFKPYVEGGIPVPVTLVVPIHVPTRYGFTK
jgi:TonB family protein